MSRDRTDREIAERVKHVRAGEVDATPSLGMQLEALFDPPGFTWDGPDIHELKKQVWPDFHHAGNLEASGRIVSFLSDEITDAWRAWQTHDEDRYAAVPSSLPRIDAPPPPWLPRNTQ